MQKIIYKMMNKVFMNEVESELLDLIDVKEKVIFDVGCFRGNFTKNLIEHEERKNNNTQNIRNNIQIDTKRELIIDNLLSELESNQAYIDDKKQVYRREMEYVNKLLLDSLTTQEIKKYPKNLSPLNPFFSVNKFTS